MRKIKLAVVAFIIALPIYFTVYSCSLMELNKVIYYFPCNYSGPVYLQFSEVKYPPLAKDNEGNMIINVPPNGVVKTSTKYDDYANYGREKYIWSCEEDEFVFDNSNHGGRIRGGISTHTYIENPESRYDSTSGRYYAVEQDLNVYCFYVSFDPKNWKNVKDSVRSNKCTCDHLRGAPEYLIDN